MVVAAYSTMLWALLWVGNGWISHFISSKIQWVENPTKRFFWGIVSTLIYTISLVLLASRIWAAAFHLTIDNYSEIITPALSITMVVSLFMHSREFLIQWKKSAVDAEVAKKESMAAQYESLKSQVNPHFLFNSLNTLTNLVYEDAEKAAKFIKQLSEVYRYVLSSKEKELIPLVEEISFIQSYIFLQQIRFGEKLRVAIEIPHSEGLIVPLALQLLIENAIKHNVIAEDQPLTIKIYGTQHSIVVENNLQRKLVVAEESSGIGLENIRGRYAFLTSEKVKIEESETAFKVEIPLLAL
jgi:LytS/YehU family sensor histidine kinase